MCGIVGARHDWLLRRGLDPESVMRRAVAELGWRGRDGSCVVRAGAWWLGCARLAITQPNSAQPVVRRGGRHVALLNGAITNARELWSRLLPRAERRTAPPNDAWLPLLAVEQQDAEALALLRGHHAYAVVDTHTGELVFGQDRYGEKPFFCLLARDATSPELVAFASTPAALRHLGMPAWAPGRELAAWFRRGFADPTPHRFGTRLRLDRVPVRGAPLGTATGGGTWWSRWHPSGPGKPRRPPRHEPGTLRERLLASVARCVDTTVPTGVLLSGGLDSSCLAMALRTLGRPTPAYQFRAAGAPHRERTTAEAVAASCGLPFRAVDAGPEVLLTLAELTRLAGQPLGDPSILAVHAVARAAASDGVRVLLGGEGADELFLGYRRYRALAFLPRLQWLAGCAPGWSMRYAARWWRAAVAGDPIGALLAVTPPAFARTVLSERLAERRVSCDLGIRHAGPGSGDLVERARRADLDGYLRCDLLPKVDIATLAAGIEARCPWLEGDFATFGADRRALGKAPIRAAFAKDLPVQVLRLPKHGFSLPLDRWFRGELPWLDLLAEQRTQRRDHLRPGGVTAVVDRHRRGRADLGHGLYLLVAYELFLRSLE